jgi:hypothetical protein
MSGSDEMRGTSQEELDALDAAYDRGYPGERLVMKGDFDRLLATARQNMDDAWKWRLLRAAQRSEQPAPETLTNQSPTPSPEHTP